MTVAVKGKFYLEVRSEWCNDVDDEGNQIRLLTVTIDDGYDEATMEMSEQQAEEMFNGAKFNKSVQVENSEEDGMMNEQCYIEKNQHTENNEFNILIEPMNNVRECIVSSEDLLKLFAGE